MRQADLKTSRFVAQEIEAGRAGQLKVDQVRAHFAGLGARAHVNVWWNGAAIDRLLDERHAALVEATARTLNSYGFTTKAEFTFANFGERGSIDVFAGREDVRAVFVGEAKSEWGSLEETLRRQDAKVRLAPKLAKDAFGWTPASVASVLVLPDESSARRVADGHARTLAAYSARGRELRAWLKRPDGDIGAVWFLSYAGLGRHGFDHQR